MRESAIDSNEGYEDFDVGDAQEIGMQFISDYRNMFQYGDLKKREI